jgi:hypothetical protein
VNPQTLIIFALMAILAVYLFIVGFLAVRRRAARIGRLAGGRSRHDAARDALKWS